MNQRGLTKRDALPASRIVQGSFLGRTVPACRGAGFFINNMTVKVIFTFSGDLASRLNEKKIQYNQLAAQYGEPELKLEPFVEHWLELSLDSLKMRGKSTGCLFTIPKGKK